MSDIALDLLDKAGETAKLPVHRVVICGYTARDRAAAERHIEELAAVGVPRPSSVPELNVFDGALATQEATIGPVAEESSGEVEPVVIFADDGDWYLTVGSDHTDRLLERVDMRGSKGACPKPIGRSGWTSSWASAHWDELELRSFVGADDVPYQRAPLTTLLPFEDLQAIISDRVGHLEGSAAFLGTVPLLTGGITCSDRYRLEIALPGGTVAPLEYRVERRSSRARSELDQTSKEAR